MDLGEHERRNSEREAEGLPKGRWGRKPQLSSLLCVGWKPWQGGMWAVREGEGMDFCLTPEWFLLSGLLDVPKYSDVQPRGR